MTQRDARIRVRTFLLCSLLFLGGLFGHQIDGIAAPFNHRRFGERHGRLLGRQLQRQRLPAVAHHGDRALDRLMKLALRELHNKGDADFAKVSAFEWHTIYQGYFTRMMQQARSKNSMEGIDDRRALWPWLAAFYMRVESKLGVQLCKALHLSDIKTINDTSRAVFHPCTFDLLGAPDRQAEYANNLCQDTTGDQLFGFVPVVSYWSAEIGCTVATWGTGAMTACGLAGMAAELLIARFACQPLSRLIYTKACSKLALGRH